MAGSRVVGPRTWWRGLALAFVVVLVAAGCGNGDDADDGATGTTAPADEVAEPAELSVTATDFAFDLGGSIEGGTLEITLENQGEEEHHIQFAKLNDGVTFDDFTAAFAEGEEAALSLVTFAGGVATTAPGDANTAITTLEPGDYAVLCFVAGADGVPHAAKGMLAPVEVTAGEEVAVEADAQVSMTDFAYQGGDDFEGSGTVEFTNDGRQPHEAAIVDLGEEGTAETFLEFMAEPQGPPPFRSAGGLQAVQPGETGTVDLDQLAPGRYAFVCFVPDVAGDGAPHFTKGMIQEFEKS